ncbi:MAG: hypothetical protein AAGJ94_09685 [Pseudomonadota bacterium]
MAGVKGQLAEAAAWREELHHILEDGDGVEERLETLSARRRLPKTRAHELVEAMRRHAASFASARHVPWESPHPWERHVSGETDVSWQRDVTGHVAVSWELHPVGVPEAAAAAHHHDGSCGHEGACTCNTNPGEHQGAVGSGHGLSVPPVPVQDPAPQHVEPVELPLPVTVSKPPGYRVLSAAELAAATSQAGSLGPMDALPRTAYVARHTPLLLARGAGRPHGDADDNPAPNRGGANTPSDVAGPLLGSEAFHTAPPRDAPCDDVRERPDVNPAAVHKTAAPGHPAPDKDQPASNHPEPHQPALEHQALGYPVAPTLPAVDVKTGNGAGMQLDRAQSSITAEASISAEASIAAVAGSDAGANAAALVEEPAHANVSSQKSNRDKQRPRRLYPQRAQDTPEGRSEGITPPPSWQVEPGRVRPHVWPRLPL